MQLLDSLDQPNAFYMRVLNNKVEEFPIVEQFFRTVVDPVIEKIGNR
jgi:hypothetical protein